MARAVLILLFSLASVWGATSLSTQATTMSMEDALHMMKGKLPHQVATLMQGLRQKKAARKAKVFLETDAARGMGKGTVDKRNVQEARRKLNEMVEQTEEKLDREKIICRASKKNQRAVLDETGSDMALYGSQATQAGGDHVMAEFAINSLETTRSKVKEELAESQEDCKMVLNNLRNEIEIMVNDSAILTKIVEMVDCPKASFLQCRDSEGNTTTTFGKQEFRVDMAQLKSKKVKGLLDSALVLGYHSGEVQPTNGDGSTQTGATDKYLNNPTGCSLASNPNCGKLLDKFLEISGELDSDIAKFREHLSTKKEQCETEHANFEAQASDITSRLENWGVAMASAIDRVIQANEGERLKTAQKFELDAKYKDTRDVCRDNVQTFKSEMCALGKIRGELYKMSETLEVISDCEVEETWEEGDCSKPCRERPTDMAGEQNLTREILSPAENGAKCPPLRLTQQCNMILCPIDCSVSEWSEWSKCSTKCGGGIRERIRSISEHERYGGEPCGPSSQTQACSLQGCDKDCELGAWSKLSSMECTKACGGGVKWSLRAVAEDAIGMGDCPSMWSNERYRYTTCNQGSCHPFGDTLVCDSKVDVVIMLDGSGSLGTAGWEATQKMGQKLAKAFNVEGVSPNARVAVQLFSGPKTWSKYRQCLGQPYQRGWTRNWVWTRRGWRSRWQYGWKVPKTGFVAANMATDCGIKWITPMTAAGHFAQDMKTVATAIAAEDWPQASTLTSLSLAQAQAELMYAREDATKVVVVVTDGMPMNPLMTTKAADKLKKNARVIWVPVTPGAPKEQLEEWASKPTDQNVVWVDDFTQLETPDVVTQIIAEVCPKAK